MRVLLTGASGFVGSHLGYRLAKAGHDVTCFIHDEEILIGKSYVRGSLESLADCERAIVRHRPDVIYHLGAQAIVPHAKLDPFGTLETNVRGTYNLLEAFRRHDDRSGTFIMASSDKAYGELPEGGYREGDPLRGEGPYDVSKSCADLIAQSYAKTYGLRVGIVRAGNIYGPGDPDPTRLIPSIIRDLRSRRRVQIMSDGTPVRDFLWIGDVVQAYVQLEEYVRGPGGQVPVAANFSGGEPISVLDLANNMIDLYQSMLASAWAREVDFTPEILGKRTGEIRRQVLDCSFARNVIGWKPQVGLLQGLIKTFNDEAE